MATNNWRDGVDPNIITDRLEKLKKIRPSGQIYYKRHDFSECFTVLNQVFVFDEKIPNSEKQQILYDSIFDTAKTGKISPARLKNKIRDYERLYLAKKEQKYFLYTTISIGKNFYINRARFDDCTITIGTKLTRGKKELSDKINELLQKKVILQQPPNDYTTVKVTTIAKSVWEAAKKSSEALDLRRGIWNLYFNKNDIDVNKVSLFSDISPINNIICGPISTMHYLNEGLTSEGSWHIPFSARPIQPVRNNNYINGMLKFESNVRKYLHKHRNDEYKRNIQKAIIRYVRALDSYDHHTTFLDLWNILEFLTNTTRQKDVVKRCLFHIVKEKKYNREILQAIKLTRNNLVHQGEKSSQVRVMVILLKWYVEVLLQFHIRNHYSFEDLTLAAEFFDLPQDKESIKGKIELLKSADKFLS